MDFSFLAAVVALGLEFKRRRMDGHASDLRRYYVELKRRRAAREKRGEKGWDESHAIYWLMLLQIPPFKAPHPIVPRGQPCPTCKVGAGENSATTITVLTSVAGLVVAQCRDCGTTWMQVEEPPIESVQG
jgi:hypothetical protein